LVAISGTSNDGLGGLNQQLNGIPLISNFLLRIFGKNGR
jgi:hypothetical protein